jgi:hypothetical protein
MVRSLLLAALLICVSCEALQQTAPAPPSAAANGVRGCTPTIAHMIPPQVVFETIIGGTSPKPSPMPSREAWAATGNWIGNEALWISLPPDGVFERRYAKLFMIPLRGGDIAISGHRLDGDRSGTFTGRASSGNIGSSVTFSTPGCWELAYMLAGSEIRFTMAVVN